MSTKRSVQPDGPTCTAYCTSNCLFLKTQQTKRKGYVYNNKTNLLEVGLQVDDADLGLLDALRQRLGPLVRLALLQQIREVAHVLFQKTRYQFKFQLCIVKNISTGWPIRL